MHVVFRAPAADDDEGTFGYAFWTSQQHVVVSPELALSIY
jgi:hypothetical protein